MNQTLGHKIKALRKKHNLTQEELAEFLGVSFQAVSKWENNIALPDISLLPTLASFFRTTIDDFFGFDVKDIDNQVRDICEKAYQYRKSDPQKSEEILQKGLEQFPNNEVLINNLLYVLDFDQRLDEGIDLSSRLAATTSDDEIKYDALRILATLYEKKGEYEYTKAILSQIPEIYFTKLSLEAYLLRGEPKLESANKQKWISYEMLLEMMDQIGAYYHKIGQNDKALQEYEKALELVEVFRLDKDWLNAYKDHFKEAINRIKN